MQALGRYVRQQNWELLKDKRVQRTSAIGLSSVCLLALVTFGVRGMRKHHTVDAASAAPAIPVGRTNQSAAQVLAVASGNVAVPVMSVDGSTTSWPREVDLGSGAGAGSRERSPSGENPPKAPSSAPSNLKGATVAAIKKMPPTVKSSVRTSLAPSKTMQPAVSPKPAAPAVSSAASTTSGPVSNGQTAESESAESDASHLSPVTPTAPTATAAVDAPPSAASTPQARYFDVGSFKESAWADSAVEKLTQLGFHAVSVHKSLLWAQSYQVRVGPYTDPQDAENARQALIAQGFKPHAAK